MSEPPYIKAPREWNRNAQKRAEGALVESALWSQAAASEQLDRFVTWLLVGSGGTAALLIANADRLVQYLGEWGHLASGVLLCLSAVAGLAAKVLGLQVVTIKAVYSSTKAEAVARFEEYEIEEEQIEAVAKRLQFSLATRIRMKRVHAAILRAQPNCVARTLAARSFLIPTERLMLRCWFWQGLFACVQIVFFLLFVIVGFASVATSVSS